MMVEGFDLATGKTLWSYNAGSDGSLFTQPPPLLGPYVVALPAPGGGMVALDLTTGIPKPIARGTGAWCQSWTIYKTQVVGYRPAKGKPVYDRVGQPAIQACQASGAPAATPRSVPGFVGAVTGGLTVWSEPAKVVAAPTR
jgi:hypothetical protein